MCDKVSHIFNQTQLSTSNHRKNCVALHRIHTSLSRFIPKAEDGNLRHTGEQSFLDVFLDTINRVLVIKRGSVPADRVIKFVGLYAHFIIDKREWHDVHAIVYRMCEFNPNLETNSNPTPVLDKHDSAETRFIANVLLHLLKGFQAREKTVRLRVVQFVSEIVAHLDELE